MKRRLIAIALLAALLLAGPAWAAGNKITTGTLESGLTVYALIYDSDGNIYNGSTFVTPTGVFADFDVALTHLGGGVYRVTMPAVGAGDYRWEIYQQTGGSPSQAADIATYSGGSFWNGTAFGADVRGWTGTAIPAPDTAGYPKVTIIDGSGTGEINTDTGKIVNVDSVALVQSLQPDSIDASSFVTGAITADAIAPAAIGSSESTPLQYLTGDAFLRIGANGAGLTAIDLPNQTMDIAGNVTGNVSGSVGSVTGAVGSLAGITFPTNFDDLAIEVTTGKVTADVALSQEDIDEIVDGVAEGTSPTDLNIEPVPTSRVFTLTRKATGLVGEAAKTIQIGDGPNTYAVEFRNDAAANQRIYSVTSFAIKTGTAGGITFGDAADYGRYGTQASARFTAVTAGNYVVRVIVRYGSATGPTSPGDIEITVVP